MGRTKGIDSSLTGYILGGPAVLNVFFIFFFGFSFRTVVIPEGKDMIIILVYFVSVNMQPSSLAFRPNRCYPNYFVP